MLSCGVTSKKDENPHRLTLHFLEEFLNSKEDLPALLEVLNGTYYNLRELARVPGNPTFFSFFFFFGPEI